MLPRLSIGTFQPHTHIHKARAAIQLVHAAIISSIYLYIYVGGLETPLSTPSLHFIFYTLYTQQRDIIIIFQINYAD